MAFIYSLAQYVAHKTNVAQQYTPQKHYRLPHPGQGILGPAPAIYASQHTTLPSAFSIMPPQDPTWHMDTSASSHLNFNASNLSTIFYKRLFPSVHVGDDKSIPVTNTGHSIIPSHHRPLHLHNVLVTPNIIKNLIYVRQFTRDNNCTIEFDAFGFSVKDYLTRHILLRCDSSGDLYPVTKPSTLPIVFLSTSASTWHQRLGHPGDQVLRSLVSSRFISCNKEKSSHICHACQLGKHVKLPLSRPSDVNLVRSMWLFKHKFHADGTLSRYKARLVANGSNQQHGVDFDETFSPVFKPATIRTVLSLESVGHEKPDTIGGVCDGGGGGGGGGISSCDPAIELLLLTITSGTKYITNGTKLGMHNSQHLALLQQIIGSLNNKFDMTDLGVLNYFLGISADRTPTDLFLSQKKYALQLLERAHMVTCNSSRTPVDTESKLGPEGALVQDPTLYRSLAGGLRHLTFTRPDLSYAVQQICLYMHDPREPHLAALKRILRYVQGTLDLGLHLYASSTTSLVGYTDADWASCPYTRRSTSGYCAFLGDNLLSWSAKRQHTLSRSSAEAEYRGVANVVAETAWLHNLLRELHSPLSTATLVYCDNVSAVYMSANPVQHQRTKHIEIDIHFVRDMVTFGQVRVLHVPSRFQYVDIFTKGLPFALFEEFRSSLSVRPLPAPTAGAY
ncbi:ribonuclease H-like domain-containing protein [Tanacetum coccineum]